MYFNDVKNILFHINFPYKNLNNIFIEIQTTPFAHGQTINKIESKYKQF